METKYFLNLFVLWIVLSLIPLCSVCVTESGVINVRSVLYGRTDQQTCSEGRPQNQLTDTQCSQEGTLEVFQGR